MRNDLYLQLWGNPEKYSRGTHVIMADRQIKRAIKKRTVGFDESMGNAKAVVICKSTGKWFMISGGWGNDDVYTAMMGAVCGDVVGSVYKRHNIKRMPNKNRLVRFGARFTDNTVMTCAVAEGIRIGLSQLPEKWINLPESKKILSSSIWSAMRRYKSKYPRTGFWSGCATWASYAGWAALTLEEAETLGEILASVSNQPSKGIEEAKVVAGCIFLLRKYQDKDKIREYVGQYASIVGIVRWAIDAFLDGTDFVDVIANAISIGDAGATISAIAGSLAEVIYPIPQDLRGRVIDRVDRFLLYTIVEAVDFVEERL